MLVAVISDFFLRCWRIIIDFMTNNFRFTIFYIQRQYVISQLSIEVIWMRFAYPAVRI